MTSLIDPRRFSKMIYGICLQQQSTLNRIENSGTLTKNVLNMAVVNESSPQSMPSAVQAQLLETNSMTKQSSQVLTKPTKLLPSVVRFDQWGFSAHIVVLPKKKSTSYRAAVHVSLLGKMYSVQLKMSYPSFTFDRMLHVRNIVPTDSAMAIACRAGNFNGARELLASGSAQGSDVTVGGWPMLDVSVNFLCIELWSVNDLASTLSRAGLLGSSACSSNMEPIQIWLTGSIICE